VKRVFSGLVMLMAILIAVPSVVAQEDCVELSIEFPNEASSEYGGIINGYVELINCADDPSTIWLEIEVEVFNTTISLGLLPLDLGAGEGINRELFLPVVPAIFGDSIAICATAYAGAHDSTAALASECWTIYVPDLGGGGAPEGSPTFGFAMSTSNGECVEVDLELPNTVQAGPGYFLEGSFELMNCGDEASIIELEASFDFFDTAITIGGIPVELGAGESIAREFRFPVPPALPSGEYAVCITATSGGVVSTTCQVVVVEGFSPTGNGQGRGDTSPHQLNEDVRVLGISETESSSSLVNYPNPFNPTTTISFNMKEAGPYTLDVYNVVGREVAQFRGVSESGQVNIEWDASKHSSGIYFYRLAADKVVETKKMMLLK